MSRKSLSLLLTVVLVLAFSVVSITAKFAQGPVIAQLTQTIITKLDAPGEPVQVLDVRVLGESVSFAIPFTASSNNWVDDLGLTLKNSSKKVITGVKASLSFKLTGKKEEVAFVLRYSGKVQPEQTLEALSSPQYLHLESTIRSRGETIDFTKASLTIEQVFFDDDTLWAQGALFHKNKKSGDWDLVSEPKPASPNKTAKFNHPRLTPQCESIVTYKACTGHESYGCSETIVNSTTNVPGSMDAIQTSEECPTSPTWNCGVVFYYRARFNPDCSILD